jgi:SmpA / OmlA family
MFRRSAGHAPVSALLILALALALVEISSPGAKGDRILPLYIAKVRPGMTRHQVASTLGRPRRISTWKVDGRALQREWHYRDRLTVGFEILNGATRRVEWIRTRSPRDRFAYGIHVGAKEARLRRLGNTNCWRLKESVGTFPSGYICSWRPPWIADPCGPHLTFYMSHRHQRIKLIQLSAIRARARTLATVLLDGCI